MKTAKQTHSASAFTPGPWRVIPDSLDIVADPSPGLRGRFIATALESNLVNDATAAVFVARDLEAIANARLIAAAPDLLAALKVLLRPLSKEEIDECPQYSQARDAVAKATGHEAKP